MKDGELLPEVPADVPIYAYWDGSKETTPLKILRWMKLTRLLRQLHLAKLLRDLRINVIYDRTYLATLDAAAGCSYRPTPRISCCVADPGPELELHARWSVALSRWFARRAYQKASVVLANSEGLRQRVLDYFQLKPDHVKVLHNLLSDLRGSAPLTRNSDSAKSDFTRNEEELNTIFSRKDNWFLVISSGRLHPQKGHQFLIEAVEELVRRRGRSLRLVIFGKGESEERLRNYVKTHQLESSITLAGFVEDPRHWYPKADLFVLPSLFEGMPNALIEAVECGVPALATTCPSGPKEILDHGCCGGLVPEGDSIAMADRIADAMDNLDQWRARAILAQERVRMMFDPEANMKKLEALLEQTAR